MSENWYYTKDGKNKSGPVTAAQLKELARSGQLQPTDMVKREDMQKWMPASQVKGIFADIQNPALKTPAVPLAVGDASRPSTPSVATTKTDSPPLTENPVMIGVALLFCFPAGLYFLWNHPNWTKNQKYAGTGALAGFLLICILISSLSQRATQKNIAEADQLWQAGQKADAVAKYKPVLDTGVTSIDRSQRPTIFQRVIEFDAENGNTSAAKAMIQKATDLNVSLSFSTPAAKSLLAEVLAEKERAGREKQAQEERARREEQAQEQRAGREEQAKENAKKYLSARQEAKADELKKMTYTQIRDLLGPTTEFYQQPGKPNPIKLHIWEAGENDFIAVTTLRNLQTGEEMVMLAVDHRTRAIIENVKKAMNK